MSLPERPFGRIARSVLGYSLLTALMIITPMVVFIPAALLHCGIRNGRRAAWAALAVALGLVALYVSAIPAATPDEGKMAWSYLAAVALAIALPAMAALPMIERGEKFGRVLVFLLAFSVLGLAVTEVGARALVEFSPLHMQETQAREVSAEFVKFYRNNGMPSESIKVMERAMNFGIFVMPGFMLAQIAVVFILSLLMFGRLKAWRELAARRDDKQAASAYLFRNLALPDWLLFAFILGGLTPLVTGMLQKVAANVLALVVFLYILQGLAIFRFVLAAVGAGAFGTLMGWMLLAFLTFTGIGPLLLGVAGLFDPFFDFRHFKKRKDDSNESHSD